MLILFIKRKLFEYYYGEFKVYIWETYIVKY